MAKKTIIVGQFLIFGDYYTDTLLPMRSKFAVLEQAKFRLNVFIVSASGGQKQLWANFQILGGSCTDLFAIFWTSAFSGVANWQQSDKVEHKCTTTNLPLSNVSKSFLYSNAFMAKSGAQSLTFKSVTNKQTDRQKKLYVFGCPGGG